MVVGCEKSKPQWIGIFFFIDYSLKNNFEELRIEMYSPAEEAVMI